jgi:hypothetical protein
LCDVFPKQVNVAKKVEWQRFSVQLSVRSSDFWKKSCKAIAPGVAAKKAENLAHFI